MIKARKFKNSWPQKTLASLLLILIVVLARGVVKQSQSKKELSSKLQDLKNEIQQLKQKKQSLLSEISKAQKEAYFEKIARENLNLKKQGEKVVAFILEQDSKANKREQKTSKLKTFWQSFLERFREIQP